MGAAELHVATVSGRSTIVNVWARNPMSLLTPRSRGESVWAYSSSYGGGMVAGDETRLDVRIDAGARCFLSTQAATKIYRNPGRRPCSHRMAATVEPAALFVFAPDPVQCFADSIYEQDQVFHLAPDSSLVLVDWISAGRIARGERWLFERYHSRNEIRRGDRPIFFDSLLLENDGDLGNRFRTGRFNCLATIVVVGKSLGEFASQILGRCAALPIEPDANVIIAASPLQEGAVLRFAGISVEAVARAIHQNLDFCATLLSDDPWSRKW